MSTINVNGGSLSAQMAYLDAETHHADDYVSERNLVVTGSNHNRPQFVKRQMTAYVNRQSARTKVEAYQVRQSFSIKELDYRNEKDRQTANKLGQELANAINKANGTNHPFIVATQADGESHLLHNHIIFCNADEHGKTIPHGLSWFKVADLNDQITGESNELHFDEQTKLKNDKQKSDNNSIVDSPLDRKFGKSEKNNDKPSADDFKTIVNDALNQATSRTEFTRLLQLQRVYIAQRHGKEDTWEKADGTLKQSISLQYGNMHKRTKALTGLTLAEMERRFKLNKQKQQRLQRTESQKVQEKPAKPRQIKAQPQLQPIKKQQKTMNPILVKLQQAKKQRSDWIKLHENEHDWQYDPEYIHLNSQIKHYERDLVAPSATAQGWKTMIATQKAIKEIKRKEAELIDEPPEY